ncbi:MAG TPA: heavy metal translocating P-type ATPase [Ignavibacteria bacterium]|nr:heavy metal translocating P-type ATPase [Ignavibacteria bacterium]HMR40454.1 heavy metal translocating P-type ATPase [Ignavibacteria bacterium]
MSTSENLPENITYQNLKTQTGANEELFEFDIIGMDCTSCARNIKLYLERLDGINSVEINYATESGDVVYDPDKIDRKKIKEEVKNTGYDLISEDDEYEAEQLKKQSLKKQKDKIYTAIALSLIIMTLSMKDHIPVINMISIPYNIILIVLFILTSVIIFWCGDKFIKGAFAAVKNKTSDMNTLITIGSLSSYFYSIYISANILFGLNIEALVDSTEVYYETAAMIITFIMIGNYLESVMKSRTQNSIKRLKELQTKVVNVIRDGVEIFIPFRKVKVDDTVLIKTGDRIPVDGVLTTGFCVVDESAMTGESLPVEKKPGDSLMSGTMLRNGYAEMKALKVGKDTMLSKIIVLVKDASDNKPKIQKLADKISSVFVPVVILISIATFLIWYFALNERFDRSLLFAVSVLIIACPCALGLASPIAIIIGVGRAAENGILFNNVDAIEQLKKVDTMCFDKTGTLTTGDLIVKNVYVINDYSKDEIMTYAVSIEKLSSHPVAKSIVNYGKDNNIKIFKDIKDFKTENGLGLRAVINNKSVLIGNESFMKNNDIKFSNILIKAGRNNLFISIGNEIEGVIELEDSIKEEAKNALADLRTLGLNIFMISGDNETAAKKTAKELKIKNYSYKTLPDEKEKIISKFQKENKNVAMVGDGINDAPSLAKADVGIAIGTGQDIAIDSADVILVKDDLNNITKAITISKKTVKIIKQNFFWAFFYNAITIPIAAGLFASYGLIISPVLAAMIMAFSDVVTVIGNSMRLKYTKL